MRLFLICMWLTTVLFESCISDYLRRDSSIEDDDEPSVVESIEINNPIPEGRILGLFKGWKGHGHPLTEFGKIHIVKKGGGWEDNGGNYGWGWGNYGPGHTTYHYTGNTGNTGWKASKKKSWLKFPKKSFGIHVKGGVGFSLGGLEDETKHSKVVVHHTPGWGWGGGNRYGWGGWNGGGGGGGGYGGDYYDDDNGGGDDGNGKGDDDGDDEERRRSDMKLDYYNYDY